ncbi:MAG: SAM-dependent methyltransferase [Chloroflexota bacterium]|jgi:SAM-dependent MidA family methyltransferase|nr:SAM-dependent methyltransferase [Chloroflexota bacterium]MDH5243777.1 SAM-dependent methyltransferase [Chloroflexota bacterium]
MDHVEAGLRREPPTDLSDVGEDVGLRDRIRAEIASGGPMPFVRFMELALYDPDGGYYRAEDPRPGMAGDFLTAPELHPIFGATLCVGLHEIWERLGRPDPFILREHGAGTGALALAILGAADDPAFRAAIRYQPVDIDPRRVAAFRERMVASGHGEVIVTANDSPFDGVILGNEVLDALPVHRVRQRDGRLMELAVTTDTAGQFREVEIEPTTSALQTRLAGESVELAEGQTAEICLALDAWIAEAAAPLARGLLLLIDYGAPAAQLYDPVRRRDGTLRAYVRHQVHDDPYRHVGRQDLTAHVDVTAVERAARAAGLATIGTTTQAEALMGLGIEERLRVIQADPATTFEAYTHLRSSLMRLLDPAAMGRFRVMAFGRDWDDDPAADPLRMFAYRLPTTR